jgi:hypothetical protein
MNNTLLFYDARCKLTLEKSGFNIDPFQIVKNGDELNERVAMLADDEYEMLLDVQRSNYSKIIKEKADALEAIRNSIYEMSVA